MPPENKIAALGSTKRLRWSHNDILRLVRGSAPILWRTALQAAELCVPITWHTSSVGVPGYSGYCPPGSRVQCDATCVGTALQAAERYVKQSVL